MFTSNPFAALTEVLPASVMQVYVVLMVLAVVAGTLFDIIHKGSAKYFFESWRSSKRKGPQAIGGAEMASLAIKTGLVDVLASGEFCGVRRRVAHLLTMYGFVIYVVTTVLMVFRYSTPAIATPSILPLLWWIGGLMTCVGGYWFWFFIRADVSAEGNSPLRIIGGSVRPVASRQRHARPDLGIPASEGELRDQHVFRLVHTCHHGAVRIGNVVQIRAHVFQARSGVREKGFLRERLQEQSAGRLRQARAVRPCPRTAPALLNNDDRFHLGGEPPCQLSFT